MRFLLMGGSHDLLHVGPGRDCGLASFEINFDGFEATEVYDDVVLANFPRRSPTVTSRLSQKLPAICNSPPDLPRSF
jgi:hypothetical protein